ncbi:hypothetical protein B0H14DRAFT_2580151 [Mycena olivaceomarginata]|nr:hypothetical protein B0H14DRAFT_2580151 [Mycena olivaceomarginata]
MGSQRAWLNARHYRLFEEIRGETKPQTPADAEGAEFPWALSLAIDAGPWQWAGGSAIDTGPWQTGGRPNLQTGERFVTLDWLFLPPHQTHRRARREIRARLRQLRAYAADFRLDIITSDAAIQEFLYNYRESLRLIERLHHLNHNANTKNSDLVHGATFSGTSETGTRCRVTNTSSTDAGSVWSGGGETSYDEYMISEFPARSAPKQQMFLSATCYVHTQFMRPGARVPGVFDASTRAIALPSYPGLWVHLDTEEWRPHSESVSRSSRGRDFFGEVRPQLRGAVAAQPKTCI